MNKSDLAVKLKILNLGRVEIELVNPITHCTDVRAAMSGTADPETGVQISVRAPLSNSKQSISQRVEV